MSQDSEVSDIPELSYEENVIIGAIETKDLRKVKEAVEGETGVSPDEISVNVLGYAHTWATSQRSKSTEDIYQYLLSKASDNVKRKHHKALGFTSESSELRNIVPKMAAEKALEKMGSTGGRKSRKSKKSRKGKSKKTRKGKSRKSRRV